MFLEWVLDLPHRKILQKRTFFFSFLYLSREKSTESFNKITTNMNYMVTWTFLKMCFVPIGLIIMFADSSSSSWKLSVMIFNANILLFITYEKDTLERVYQVGKMHSR